MTVVAVKQTGKLVGAMGRGIEGRSISPLTQRRLDKAFRFSVGLGRIGSGADMLDPELATGPGKGQRMEAGTVVGHDALEMHAEALVVNNGLL